VTLERDTLHVMDDTQRIALVETRTQGDDGSPAQLVRWQLANHLGSASLELDDAGQVMSYEEYYPYGSTSYQAVTSALGASLKRYRFLGRERDEETGFSYHGARYYASWLSRWTSADPAGLVDGPNPYAYSRNSPTTLSDPGGMQAEDDPQYAGTTRSGDQVAFHWYYAAGGRATEIQESSSITPDVTYYSGTGSDLPSHVLDSATGEWLDNQIITVEGKGPDRRVWYDKAFDLDRGIGESLWGVAEGAYNMVRHPVQTAEGLAYMQLHPIATLEGIGHGILNRASAVFSADVEALGKTVGDVGSFFIVPEVEAAEVSKVVETAEEVSKAAEGLEAENAAEKLAAKSEAPAKGGGMESEPPSTPPTGGGGDGLPAGGQPEPWQETARVLEDIVVDAEPTLPRGTKWQPRQLPHGEHAMRINSSRTVLPSLNRTRHAIQAVWDLRAEGLLQGATLENAERLIQELWRQIGLNPHRG
jgi:RHS repeat-associated protein